MTTALYRRYRPETFADVIGQEHVTDPLMAAIDKDRINHAYLFSGPRGCGKTTSARILARCLNCAQGPTSTPCGTCDSCVELARNGSGSLDVIEIDAASHGGVDDARDLRERATFAPVRDRFKIFIIDEAHMVTSAGFNALLKIVEEPPEHILFIFATTEPDKVIGTIRSRTHHYPFRLVPPEPLMAYLDLLCRQESVPVAPGVLSLVIRAGGGSVRDSLSVLDQLMAGANENGLDYELAVSLLGYTHATLLDDVVDSIAAGDAGTVFNAVDRVIQTGHDPRRFVEDLLERFRDLIVINAVPEGAASILRGVPDDQLNRMRTQATQLGAGELSRAADVTNTALTEMTGATSPRLHLELLCARLLLPAADASARGTLARVDRIERRLEYAGGTGQAETIVSSESSAPAAVSGRGPSGAASAPDSDVAASSGETPVEAPAAPRSRLDVPRTAEEAAARWALPTADPHTPAVPAAVPGAHSPAIPSAVRPSADGGSSDWGASWGVSNSSAFAEPETPKQPAVGGKPDVPQQPAGQPAAAPNAPAQSAPPTPTQPEPSSPSKPPGPSAPSGPSTASGPSALSPERRSEPTAVPAHADSERRDPDQTAPDHGMRAADASSPARPVEPSAESAQRPQRQDGPGTQPQSQTQATGGTIEMVRRAWPEIMDEVARIKRATWMIVNVSAKPRSFEGNQFVLAFANQGNAIGFQRGPHVDNLKQAIHKVLGLTCSIEAMYDAGGSGESGPKVPGSEAAPGSTPEPGVVAPPDPRPTADTRSSIAPTTASPAAPRISSPSAPAPTTPAASQQPIRTPSTSDATPAVSASGAPARRPDAKDANQTEINRGRDVPLRTPAPQRESQRVVRPPSNTGPAPATGSKRPSPASPDAVGAWDPSMSDDSWALVEPPEDAFDPGADWQSPPEDPDQRPAAAQRAEQRVETPSRGPAPEQDRESRSRPQRGPGSHPAPSTGDTLGTASSNGVAEPVPPVDSRSVVWSPALAPTPRRGPVIPGFLANQSSETQATSPPASAGQATDPRTTGPTRPTRPTASGSHAAPPHPGLDPEPRAVDPVRQKPVSRYQQLLDEAERKRAEEQASTRGAVDLRFVEDEPSADDETLEESGLVGRTAIERILNGRLVEERSIDGQ